MKYALFSLAALFFAPTVSAQTPTQAQSLPTSPLVIDMAEASFDLTVELADEPLELATGLMFREGISPDKGMLFDFGEPREANMFMRNVPFGLDMLFVDEDGKILAIVSHVQPFSERTINPGMPVKGVLEIGAGRAKEIGVAPGDTLKHDLFGNFESTVSETASDE